MGGINNQEIKSFTGLRGIAALYVVFFHFHLNELLSGPLKEIVLHGYLAVDLFFILSGFVIALVYSPMFQKGVTRASLTKFILRRLARIYPLFLFVFGVTVTFLALTDNFKMYNEPITLKDLMANLLMVQSWGLGLSVVSVSWSISAEWAAYILFPLIIGITLTNSAKNCVVTFLACLACLTCLSLLPRELTEISPEHGPLALWKGTTLFPLIRCIAEFTLGMTCYRFAASEKAKILNSNFVSAAVLSVIIILLAIPNSDIFIIYLLPLLIISLVDDQSLVAKIFSWKPIHFLGVISYSFYLTHEMSSWFSASLKTQILNFGIPMPNLMLIILKLCICILFAAVTYQLIEKPGRLVLRKLFEPRRKISDEGNPNLSAP